MDTELLRRAAATPEKVERLEERLQRTLHQKGATREELVDAMSHYFLACGIAEGEVGFLAYFKLCP